MILAIDIGNTTVEIGFVEENFIKSYKLSSDLNKTIDDWFLDFILLKNIEKNEVKAGFISSVVPNLTEKIKNAIKKSFDINIYTVGEDIQVPIKINYEKPEEVGIDRVLNAYAGINISEPPLIIIDLGTAITFDIVNEKGEYEGGAIFPGMESSIFALFSKTAKLPKVDIKIAEDIIGKTTVKSIQSGIYFGYVSLIDGMIEKFQKKLNNKASVILTGGHSEIISSGLSHKHILEKNLSLIGIKLLSKSVKLL